MTDSVNITILAPPPEPPTPDPPTPYPPEPETEVEEPVEENIQEPEEDIIIENTVNFPRFSSELETPQSLEIGIQSTWVLPEIETDGFPLADIIFTPDPRLERFFEFDKSSILQSQRRRELQEDQSTAISVTWNGHLFTDGAGLVGDVLFIELRLIDAEPKLTFHAQPIEINFP